VFKITVAVGLLVTFALGVPGAEKELNVPALTPFDPVQIRGDLKVTLIEISRSTLFTDHHVRSEYRKRLSGGSATYAVPALEIAFVVERIGKKPIKSHGGHDSGVRVFRDGKRIEEIKGIVPGGVSTSLEFVDGSARFSGGLPKVRDAKLAFIRHHMKAGIVVRDGDDIRIEFLAGHGEEKATFSFDHVPIR